MRGAGLGTALSLMDGPQGLAPEVTYGATAGGSQDFQATSKVGKQTREEKGPGTAQSLPTPPPCSSKACVHC